VPDTELPQAVVVHIAVPSIHLYVLTIVATELAKPSSCLRAVEPSLPWNFPQQAQLEGRRGDRHSHPHLRGKAFNPL